MYNYHNANILANSKHTDPSPLDEYDCEEDSEQDYSSYNLEEEGPNNGKATPAPFKLLFKILTTPVEGWKATKRSGINVDKWAQGCYYPLLACLAICCFSIKIYNPNEELNHIISNAVEWFTAYFMGYFIVMILCKALLPQKTGESFHNKFGKVFIMASLSSMAMFSILTMMLPMLEPILVFLPIWTTYIIYKGIRFVIPRDANQTMTILIVCLLVIGVPNILLWIFSLMIRI